MKHLRVLLTLIFVLSLAGCASTRYTNVNTVGAHENDAPVGSGDGQPAWFLLYTRTFGGFFLADHAVVACISEANQVKCAVARP